MTAQRIGMTGPVNRFVRGLGRDYYTRNEVAAALDLSVDTLKSWAQEDPDLGPVAYVNYGAITVYLYTEAEVERLGAHAEQHWPARANGLRTRKRGRPQMWTERELLARRSQLRRAIYLTQRARRAMAKGHENLALRCATEADEIRAELDARYAERFAWSTRPRLCA